MGIHAKFVITCDVCLSRHDDGDEYPDQARQRARGDGWEVSLDNEARCPGCWQTKPYEDEDGNPMTRLNSGYAGGYWVISDPDTGNIYCEQGSEVWWQAPPKIGTGWAPTFLKLRDAQRAAARVGGVPEWVT